MVVGLAELAVAGPGNVLSAYGLGSGLAVVIWDSESKVGGLLHAMLPESGVDRTRAQEYPGMFLDTGIEALLSQALKAGASKERLRICLAGGAEVIGSNGKVDIGGLNLAAAERCLKRLNLTVQAAETGRHSNRSITLHTSTGRLTARVPESRNEIVIC